MSGTPIDPLQTLQAALTAPANSKDQSDLLTSLRESLESHPAPIPLLVGTLISLVLNQPDSTLKRWVLELLQFAICRSALSIEARTTLSTQSLDMLNQLLDDPSSTIVKLAIQSLTAVYPLLFRNLCITRSNPGMWNVLSTAKTRILGFVWSPEAKLGVKLCSVKFLQRVILVQTRGVSDPRLQKPNDPNLALCPVDHPFIHALSLETEGTKLLEGMITLLYSSSNPDLLTSILNSWTALTKLRPNTMNLTIAALKSWTPAALTGQSASNIKSVEKALKIQLIHISRTPNSGLYVSQINETLSHQAVRMDRAAQEEKQRKAALLDSRKRPSSALDTSTPPFDSKRAKLDPDAPSSSAGAVAAAGGAGSSLGSLAGFDFTTLPASLITDLIVANLEAHEQDELGRLIGEYKIKRGIAVAAAPIPAAPAAVPTQAMPSTSTAPATATATAKSTTPPPGQVKEEPVDPLQMDIDEEELVYEPGRIDQELSGLPQPPSKDPSSLPSLPDLDLKLLATDFKLPPPPLPSDEDERYALIAQSTERIMDGKELGGSVQLIDAAGGFQASAGDLWMMMIIRLITRVARPPWDVDPEPEPEDEDVKGENKENGRVQKWYEMQDRQRQTLCDYIIDDLPGRVRLATLWMNEEWYNDQTRIPIDPQWQPNYETWLNQIVAAYQTHLDGKDRTFARFLLDLPHVPPDILALLRDMCVETERMAVGFSTLKSFVVQRPSLRVDALTILLELTTHPEKMPRTAAINTVRQWVPNSQPMDTLVRDFALSMLRKLQSRPGTTKTNGAPGGETKDGNRDGDEDGDDKMEDGQLTPEEIVQTPYLPDRVELPAQKAQVLQHVELLFALSVKVPEFLDEIFEAYAHMDETVQSAIQDLITALIRSLGSNNGKLLTLMRNFPDGSESLALRILTIFTSNGRPSAQLVALVKGLVSEKNLDARFLIPIIAEMDKADIIRHLPRIVSALNGQPGPKNLVRSVFSSVVTTPPQSFGSISSNMPRVRQSELLTPAELMVLLHESEKEIGLKSAIEAIGICFSMTDVFRSEILAVVMQQIMDERDLPVLFLRTVIQAVTTYKTLVGFVSTTLLSRLITKKIWTNPPLWEGFIRCAKAIAPASFGALLQLPKEQLRELVERQPSLKSGLKDFVTKKAGNKARAMAGLMDIFGDAEDGGATPMDVSTPTPATDSAATTPQAPEAMSDSMGTNAPDTPQAEPPAMEATQA